MVVRLAAVVGAASFTRPELAGIALALEESLPDEDLTQALLTDSLVAIDISQPYNLRQRIGLHAVNQKLRVYNIIRVINVIFLKLYIIIYHYITFYSFNSHTY